MAGVAAAAFMYLEAPVTAGAGVYSLVAPIAFINDILPPRVLDSSRGVAGDMREVLEFAVRIYGLTLVLLGLAELLIFKLSNTHVAAKKALLIPMALCDVIHIAVFAKSWLVDAHGTYTPVEEQIQDWQQREWVAVFTNGPMVGIFLLLRLIYMIAAREPNNKRLKRE